jgi:ppGpp synthetase/RelA/SpoT-type nucleotidyltranferase
VELTKTKIDKIGERLKDGELDADILVQLSHYRNQFSDSYRIVEGVLRDHRKLQVSGRPAKSTTAIVEKLRRESVRLSQIQDIAGCRVIVPGMISQEEVVDDLRVLLERPKIIDRRENPSHGYRAVHIVTFAFGLPVEVQVRTHLQHIWADISEKLADQYGQDIKYGKGNEKVVSALIRVSQEVKAIEKLRYDGNMIKSGRNSRFYKATTDVSPRKLVKELERLDRERIVRIRQILSEIA